MVTKSIPSRKAVAGATKPVAKKAAAKTVRRAAGGTSARRAGKAVDPLAQAALVSATATDHPPVDKQKLVRDSFTIPKREYDVLGVLKERLVRLARPTKKGELLRAGIACLAAMSDAQLLAAVAEVPSLKTGRPKESMGKGSKAAVRKA